MRAANAVSVQYEPLPVVNSARQAYESNEVLVHENLGQYIKVVSTIYPRPGTNIADLVKIRKGDIDAGLAESQVVAETSVMIPQKDHAAMETRSASAQIFPDGRVIIHSATQGPFSVQEMISKYFNIHNGKVIVISPLVGGAFGGKTPVQLELIAYLASKAVGGRPVKLVNTREQDIRSSPVGIGLEATIKLGARRDGKIAATHMTYLIDSGAYSDTSPDMARAIAACCTGPYNIDNVWCDAFCLYTNHTFTTAFRSFGHMEFTFAVERAMDKLAYALGMCPVELRRKNLLLPGNTSPTGVRLTTSNLGDLVQCVTKAKQLMNWDEGQRIEDETGGNKVRAKGICCFWKTSLAQILAEELKMDINKIHVDMQVNTQFSPHYWKTVASMSNFMVGRAVIEAARDAIRQLTSVAATVLRCPPEDLQVSGERISLKDDSSVYLEIKDIAHGYKYPDGNSIGGQIIGKGRYTMRRLTPMEHETGHGRPGPGYTVAAQGVEVEFDKKNFTYKILKAVTVLDAGNVINLKMARGVIMGGMCMGLNYGSRECLIYSDSAIITNPQFRLYRFMRAGENPSYSVDFVETPQVDAPFGARGFGEHRIVAMPAALASALSAAAEVELARLPLTPEQIWRTKEAALVYDPV